MTLDVSRVTVIYVDWNGTEWVLITQPQNTTRLIYLPIIIIQFECKIYKCKKNATVKMNRQLIKKIFLRKKFIT